MVIEFKNSSVLVSTRFRFSFTNIYSVDEYKKQSLLFYLKYFVLYKLMHSPSPSFKEKQMLLFLLEQRVEIKNFLELCFNNNRI